MPWEHFPHGADIGIRGIGASLNEAFEQAAIALIAVITDPGMVDAKASVTIRCEAPDEEMLLTDWLNALIFEMSTRGMLFGRFDVDISDHRLDAIAWGEAVDRQRHHPAVEVKGATYTELSVALCDDGRWTAQCVVDV
ncbi:MAG TPA: archease [Casimicrobiaceae bacterium]|nr:archease [Casimicrobiaceae bacterium]